MFAGPAQATSINSEFRLLAGSVTPKETTVGSVKPVRIHFKFDAAVPVSVDLRIESRQTGRSVYIRRSLKLDRRNWHHLSWDGRRKNGTLVRPGQYTAYLGEGSWARIGKFRLRSHQFPVAGRHGTRGYIGEFGAPRNGGRTHEGFDVTSPCGTPLVAVRSGRILKKAYDPLLYGHYVVLKGEGERRTYKYSHLLRSAPVSKGQKVRASRRLGAVGQTGNAASTPCHLHIEVRSRGRLLNPEPLLRSWDR